MNSHDILKYGQSFLTDSYHGIPNNKWNNKALGSWTAKDLLAHMLSTEYVLLEVLTSFLDKTVRTPYLDKSKNKDYDFNNEEVKLLSKMSIKNLLRQIDKTHKKTLQLIKLIPKEVQRKPGTLPWYGNEYSLEDFIVYTSYGHKREHGAHFHTFKESIKR